jgi:hypothetical protein
MARPVAHYLMRFGEEPEAPRHEARELFVPFPVREPEEEEERIAVAEHLQQLDAAREDARAEGYETAHREIAEEFARRLQTHQEELAAARRDYLEQASDSLLAGLHAGLAEIEARLADGLGNVLLPFVVDRLRRQMVADLLDAVTTLIASREAVAIKIAGPADLVEMLRGKLAQAEARIDFEVNDAIDVSVRAEQTVIETQLATWIARLGAEME